MNKSYIIIMNEEEQQKKSFNKFHEIHLLSGHDLFLFSPILRNGLIESNHIHAGRSEVSRAMLYEMDIWAYKKTDRDSVKRSSDVRED